MYTVRTDVKVGTYKTKGNPNCYYVILSSTTTSDIVDSSILKGQDC